MKILFIVPEIRMDSAPAHFPFWAAILASIVEKKGGQVGILDLNALRMKYDRKKVPTKIIEEEIGSEDWDLIGIGGLTTVYNRIKELAPIIKKISPSSVFLGGGGWSSYNPDEILELIPELDLICIGEGEETFSEIYETLEKKSNNFENINGLCLRGKERAIFTKPRALIDDLNTVPYPAYHLLETDVYFSFSSLPYSVESFNSKRRASVVWERGCPRGCTFCSHNGMSRIDLQNIYGNGDRKAGEKLVRISDKENNTFQLPARWPSPSYAIENIKILHENYNVDFISIVDENMTSNKKWTTEFCNLYKESGLNDKVKWGTLGDAPSVATKPELIQTMKDAGCAYISFGFESASDKVLSEDIQKGQTRQHLQQTLDTILKSKLTPLTTFMIGNQHENINDLMETMDFWIQNNAEIDPFICTPYVGSPIYFNNKNRILAQYDPKIKLIEEGKLKVNKETENKWRLNALDMFMRDCGDAYQYTVTISEYFTIPELFAIKNLMYQKDAIRLLAWAHERYEETHQPQWKHDVKWAKYCNVCKAESLMNESNLPHQI